MTEEQPQRPDELDAAVERLVRSGARPHDGEADLDALMEIAVRLRGLPDPAFRARLIADLLPPLRGRLSAVGANLEPNHRGVHVTAATVPVDTIAAHRIGLIADNHSRRDDGSDLPQAALDALQGVDLILHCGDTGNVGTLDRLQTLAPVLAVPGGHVDGGRGREDPRLAPTTRVVVVDGVRIGMIHEIGKHGIAVEGAPEGRLAFPDVPINDILASKFGQPVEVVAFGGTHFDMVGQYQGVLLVNPGSPNLPAQRRTPDELGTIAILEIRDQVIGVQVVRLRSE
jgi:putative phosphoesterase